MAIPPPLPNSKAARGTIIQISAQENGNRAGAKCQSGGSEQRIDRGPVTVFAWSLIDLNCAAFHR